MCFRRVLLNSVPKPAAAAAALVTANSTVFGTGGSSPHPSHKVLCAPKSQALLKQEDKYYGTRKQGDKDDLKFLDSRLSRISSFDNLYQDASEPERNTFLDSRLSRSLSGDDLFQEASSSHEPPPHWSKRSDDKFTVSAEVAGVVKDDVGRVGEFAIKTPDWFEADVHGQSLSGAYFGLTPLETVSKRLEGLEAERATAGSWPQDPAIHSLKNDQKASPAEFGCDEEDTTKFSAPLRMPGNCSVAKDTDSEPEAVQQEKPQVKTGPEQFLWQPSCRCKIPDDIKLVARYCTACGTALPQMDSKQYKREVEKYFLRQTGETVEKWGKLPTSCRKEYTPIRDNVIDLYVTGERDECRGLLQWWVQKANRDKELKRAAKESFEHFLKHEGIVWETLPANMKQEYSWIRDDLIIDHLRWNLDDLYERYKAAKAGKGAWDVDDKKVVDWWVQLNHHELRARLQAVSAMS